MAEVVQEARSGQPRQAAPKVTARVQLIGRVTPWGQVAVPADSSTVKSGGEPAGHPGQGSGVPWKTALNQFDIMFPADWTWPTQDQVTHLHRPAGTPGRPAERRTDHTDRPARADEREQRQYEDDESS